MWIIIVANEPLNFHQYLIPKIEPLLIDWATGEGSFVILALLESDFVPADVKVELKSKLSKSSNLKALKKAKEGRNKGTAIILDLIQ